MTSILSKVFKWWNDVTAISSSAHSASNFQHQNTKATRKQRVVTKPRPFIQAVLRDDIDRDDWETACQRLSEWDSKIIAVWLVSNPVRRIAGGKFNHWIVKFLTEDVLLSLDFAINDDRSKGSFGVRFETTLPEQLSDFLRYRDVNPNWSTIQANDTSTDETRGARKREEKWRLYDHRVLSYVIPKFNVVQYMRYYSMSDDISISDDEESDKALHGVKPGTTSPDATNACTAHKKEISTEDLLYENTEIVHLTYRAWMRNRRKNTRHFEGIELEMKVKDLAHFLRCWTDRRKSYGAVYGNCQTFAHDLWEYMFGKTHPEKMEEIAPHLQSLADYTAAFKKWSEERQQPRKSKRDNHVRVEDCVDG